MTDEQRKKMGASNKALLRIGRPEEIAYGVLFLVSDEATFVTGHALVVDGGQPSRCRAKIPSNGVLEF